MPKLHCLWAVDVNSLATTERSNARSSAARFVPKLVSNCARFLTVTSEEAIGIVFQSAALGRDRTHSLAFMRIEEGVPEMRSAGSQFWAGVLNTHCWFDPNKNLAAVLMTQSLPFVEPRFMDVYDRFERAVYAQ
jgi:CubicO group peptidase (beta-lactamase class C family)